MYIPIVKDEYIYDEVLVDLYKSKFRNAPDIISCKRNILIHGDLDFKRSAYEGLHTIKCTIINLAYLDGRYHQDTSYNPEEVLAKTVYNGYIIIPYEDIKDGELKISPSLISKAKIKLINAYTSHMGLWSAHSEFDHHSPFGASVMNMQDLQFAIMNSRHHVNIEHGELLSKVEVSFDGSNYTTVLPLPFPQYYSRLHSEVNGDNPIITYNKRLQVEDICDEYTKVSVLKFKVRDPQHARDYLYDGDGNARVLYYGPNGEDYNHLKIDEKVPLFAACGTLRSMVDELFSKIFRLFNLYQVSSMDFIYDSDRKIITVPSLTFSWSPAPKDFAKNFIHEFIEESILLNALDEISDYHGESIIVGRITDLKYDLVISFKENHRMLEKLKTIKYSSSVFDILNSLTTFSTSVKEPITML